MKVSPADFVRNSKLSFPKTVVVTLSVVASGKSKGVDIKLEILPKEGKAGLLSSIARQGRAWGFPLWLASQDADSFITRGDNVVNFAELAECGVHFSPETLNDSQQRKLIGEVIHRQLKKGETVLTKKGNISIGIARQFYRRFD